MFSCSAPNVYPLLKHHRASLFPISPPLLRICLNYWLPSDLSEGSRSHWRFRGDADRKVERNKERKGGWAVARPLILGQLWARPSRPEISICLAFLFLPLCLPSPSLFLVFLLPQKPLYNKMLKSLQEIKTNLSKGDMGIYDANLKGRGVGLHRKQGSAHILLSGQLSL